MLNELVTPLGQAFEDDAVGIRHLAAASARSSRVCVGWHNSASLEELRKCFVEQGFEIVPHDYLFEDCIATPGIILNELRLARSGPKREAPAKKTATPAAKKKGAATRVSKKKAKRA